MTGTRALPARKEPDLISLVYELTSQIPKGMVSTYGDIAAAMGDPVAARMVGEVLSKNPTPIVVPCHRVVYSTGRAGWYGGHGKGAAEKERLLGDEGVKVVEGTVQDLKAIRFKGFRSRPVLRGLHEEQTRLGIMVVEKDEGERPHLVAGLDVSYDGPDAYGAIVICDLNSGKLVEERTEHTTVRFPYIPTYLAYRELPVLRPLIDRREGIVYLVDGHGVLHPRGAGIASQLGLMLEVPTIGAAKRLLVGKVGEARDGRASIFLDGELKGYRLGTGKRSTYISVGHRVSLATAVAVCEPLIRNGIPSPLRRAHELANEFRRSHR